MLPDDVNAEQQRINRADALVLVYPIYWWSFPAQLKGWIDRVFTQGWAYDERDGKLVKLLGHLPVHLIALGGADQRTYARYGYFGSMKTQIDRVFSATAVRLSLPANCCCPQTKAIPMRITAPLTVKVNSCFSHRKSMTIQTSPRRRLSLDDRRRQLTEATWHRCERKAAMLCRWRASEKRRA